MVQLKHSTIPQHDNWFEDSSHQRFMEDAELAQKLVSEELEGLYEEEGRDGEPFGVDDILDLQENKRAYFEELAEDNSEVFEEVPEEGEGVDPQEGEDEEEDEDD